MFPASFILEIDGEYDQGKELKQRSKRFTKAPLESSIFIRVLAPLFPVDTWKDYFFPEQVKLVS